jgi:hypothetical protein
MPKTSGRPPFSVVSSETTAGAPPRDLGQHGRALWDAVMREYAIADIGGRELLAQAAGALDLIEALGEAIARDGAIVYGRAGPKAHPAVKPILRWSRISRSMSSTRTGFPLQTDLHTS